VLKKEYGGNETKAAENMPYQTLVVAKRPQGGFYILNSQSYAERYWCWREEAA
jgi:hypothetical protein